MHKKGYFSVIFVTEPLCIPGSRKKICIENKIGSVPHFGKQTFGP